MHYLNVLFKNNNRLLADSNFSALKLRIFFFLVVFLLQAGNIKAQKQIEKVSPHNKWFSLGVRSTVSLFDRDGNGLGTGGQFRVQLSKRINTDWFGDYISINVNNLVRSEYYHIGWSVLYYVFENQQYPEFFQPYILAGHCFDYNKKTVMQQAEISKDRWGSAVQAGIGTHMNLSERVDVSVNCQYMIHLTKELEVVRNNELIDIKTAGASTLEGHLLGTISVNYKLFKMGGK